MIRIPRDLSEVLRIRADDETTTGSNKVTLKFANVLFGGGQECRKSFHPLEVLLTRSRMQHLQLFLTDGIGTGRRARQYHFLFDQKSNQVPRFRFIRRRSRSGLGIEQSDLLRARTEGMLDVVDAQRGRI